MATITNSVKSLGSAIKKPKVLRKHLSRYSWLPDVLRIEGSIATKIVGPVLTITIIAAAVAYAFSKGKNVTLSNTVTPLLAVVVGLILVFRNGTSYDRYYEGRKDFGAMTANIRNLVRLIWINVAVPAPGDPASSRGKTPGSGLNPHQLRQKKINAVKLCVSFAFAVKHHLRDEPGLDYADYEDVLPSSFARFDELGFDTTSTPPMAQSFASVKPSPTTEEVSSHRRHHHRPKHHPAHLHGSSGSLQPDQNTPLLSDSHRTVQFHPFADQGALPLPLIIAHELSRTLFKFKRDGYLETLGPAGANAMSQLSQGMVDQLTAMERVANTPIPISYGIHLKQCVTLYLATLPFTLVRDLNWWTIPIVTVVAFTLMGIEGIANEIEMPFGTDTSDLPLDRYCAELKNEADYTIDRLAEGGEGIQGYDDGEGDD
ncbi:UPF0187-domain-containing protein [Rickenella mellea]|uniref:UPF0187-domain-containing protein n=1 Tax=Rickenella mellea TaxID=50990 RepID=A0A4Y7QKK8_9AGAM|nr:UPF0187-domain-containing protein [Rickenella mellea]